MFFNFMVREDDDRLLCRKRLGLHNFYIFMKFIAFYSNFTKQYILKYIFIFFKKVSAVQWPAEPR